MPQVDSQIVTQPIASIVSTYLNAESNFNLPPGSWQYSGSTTWEAINALVQREIIHQNKQFRLIYTHHPTLPNGSGTGIKMLINGQISFAFSSRPVNDAEYDAAIIRGKILKQVPVAIDGLAVVVNPLLNLDSLTVKQLADIYRGKITNWQEIGGQDLPIVPYARPLQSGTTEFFRNNILKDRIYGKNVIFLEESKLAIKQVQARQNLGGVYFVSASEVINNCQLKIISLARHSRTIPVSFVRPRNNCDLVDRNTNNLKNLINLEVLQTGEYPLVRRLFMIIEVNSPIDEEVGEAYKNMLLSKQGQKRN